MQRCRISWLILSPLVLLAAPTLAEMETVKVVREPCPSGYPFPPGTFTSGEPVLLTYSDLQPEGFRNTSNWLYDNWHIVNSVRMDLTGLPRASLTTAATNERVCNNRTTFEITVWQAKSPQDTASLWSEMRSAPASSWVPLSLGDEGVKTPVGDRILFRLGRYVVNVSMTAASSPPEPASVAATLADLAAKQAQRLKSLAVESTMPVPVESPGITPQPRQPGFEFLAAVGALMAAVHLRRRTG